MRSIPELSAEANKYNYNSGISFASWTHVCKTLLREAKVYSNEGTSSGLERSYILNLRFADLVLNKLTGHPHFDKKAYKKVYDEVPGALNHSEDLKKRLAERPPPAGSPSRRDTTKGNQHKPRDSAFEASSPSIREQEHRDTRRNSSLDSSKSGYASQDDGLAADTSVGIHMLDFDESLATLKFLKNPLKHVNSSGMSQHHQQQHQKHVTELSYPGVRADPPRRGSTMSKEPEPAIKTEISPGNITSVFTTEMGAPLRNVFIPSQLRSRFLEIAAPNTKANLETCGMLCGKLTRNAFFVTDLLVPHQISTPDSCATTHEEELFEYVDKRDLFLVGWIHTHPSQSCFMSSVDLHTHASYQIMLPEAVAIVCAPTANPSWGAFRLTDPPGLDVIKACPLTGFHQHSQGNLYKLARPGHYRELEFDLTAVDLRDNPI